MGQITRTDIDSQLLAYVNDEVASAEVAADTDLLLTGAVDSIGVMRITQWMQDEYGCEVEPIEITLENFQTVAQMCAFVHSKMS